MPPPAVKRCAVLAFLLASCSSSPPARDPIPAGPPVRASIVFVIHGDANYVYHDALGNSRRADAEVLAQARRVGEQNPNAEVLIFHEIPRRHVLFVIPRRDGRAYYYRHGRLVAESSYWRDEGDSRFDPEARLYQELAAQESRPPVRMLLYFGHEIPELERPGYDGSERGRVVTVDDFAEGVHAIAGEVKPLDLLVLATCFGGTPHTIGALAPYARTIVASPENLHLSYFDLEPFAALDVGSDDSEIAAFAHRFARHAFERLAAEVQTAVSVVVYDVHEASSFLDSIAGAYERARTAASGRVGESVERCDCVDDPAIARPDMSRGLTVLYRAARFGRAKTRTTHSGWECYDLGATASARIGGA